MELAVSTCSEEATRQHVAFAFTVCHDVLPETPRRPAERQDATVHHAENKLGAETRPRPRGGSERQAQGALGSPVKAAERRRRNVPDGPRSLRRGNCLSVWNQRNARATAVPSGTAQLTRGRSPRAPVGPQASPVAWKSPLAGRGGLPSSSWRGSVGTRACHGCQGQ